MNSDRESSLCRHSLPTATLHRSGSQVPRLTLDTHPATSSLVNKT